MILRSRNRRLIAIFVRKEKYRRYIAINRRFLMENRDQSPKPWRFRGHGNTRRWTKNKDEEHWTDHLSYLGKLSIHWFLNLPLCSNYCWIIEWLNISLLFDLQRKDDFITLHFSDRSRLSFPFPRPARSASFFSFLLHELKRAARAFFTWTTHVNIFRFKTRPLAFKG